jgi:hypothetical protein
MAKVDKHALLQVVGDTRGVAVGVRWGLLEVWGAGPGHQRRRIGTTPNETPFNLLDGMKHALELTGWTVEVLEPAGPGVTMSLG